MLGVLSGLDAFKLACCCMPLQILTFLDQALHPPHHSSLTVSVTWHCKLCAVFPALEQVVLGRLQWLACQPGHARVALPAGSGLSGSGSGSAAPASSAEPQSSDGFNTAMAAVCLEAAPLARKPSPPPLPAGVQFADSTAMLLPARQAGLQVSQALDEVAKVILRCSAMPVRAL